MRIHEQLRKAEVMGINGSHEPARYVPLTKLQECWDLDDVDEVLKRARLSYGAHLIWSEYLRVFSTFVRIDRVRYLEVFVADGLTDSKGPSYPFHDHWPSSYHHQFYDEFQASKWTFFPFEFDRNELVKRRLDPGHILPMAIEKVIWPKTDPPPDDDSKVKVSKIRIHKDFNKLGAAADTFVLKAWPRDSASFHDYERERNAYMHIQEYGWCDNVVKLCGSFEQGETSYLILELVEGSNLQQYLDQTPPPTTPSDILDFWSSILGLLYAIRKVHMPNGDLHGIGHISVIHRDLKFDNVLVAQESSSKYKFQVKLGDFGCSSLAFSKEKDTPPRGTDQYGNSTYSAPEASHHLRIYEDGPDEITIASDIWSLGCMMLDLSAWVAGGNANLDWFENLRREELESHPSFKGSSYTHCFHNGSDLLASVREACREFKQQSAAEDKFTPQIIDTVLKVALDQLPSNRITAKHFYFSVDAILKSTLAHRSDGGLSPNRLHASTSQDSSPSPSAQRSSTSTEAKGQPPRNSENPPPSRKLAMQNITEYLKLQRDGHGQHEKFAPEIKSQIEILEKFIDGRDHLFFIDNSGSMSSHKELVLQQFKWLSEVARLFDADRLELAFASSPTKIYKSSSTEPLVNVVKDHEYDFSRGDLMEHQLNKFFRKALFPKLSPYRSLIRRLLRFRIHRKPITVIIFTDGNWKGASPGSGVQNPIQALMDRMRHHRHLGGRLDRTHVTLQFLHFGDDEIGKANLEELDTFGMKEKFDIVNTTSPDSSLVKIFLSSISEHNDKNQK